MVTKNEVLDTIKKYMVKTLDNMDAAAFDPVKSMADYGANSLDIVDIVSSTLRELKIKIPRTELTGLTNIDAFANVVVEHANKAVVA